jgi:hypothetical protein
VALVRVTQAARESMTKPAEVRKRIMSRLIEHRCEEAVVNVRRYHPPTMSDR